MLKENKILNPELAKNVNADLLPTDERIMDPLSYGASFMGGCVSIGTFSMGASLIGALTIAQAIIAMCIGCAVIAHKYGVPFTVQARQSFGFAGVKIPGFMRGIPAIVWFGFQSWVGAGAINSCLKILFGVSNMPVVFALFTILQVALAIKGFKEIKWLENVSCVFIIGILIYMLYVVNTKFAGQIGNAFGHITGTWGMPFWAATTSFLGIYATMIVNASDYSRNLKHKTGPVATGSIYTAAILPVTLFMGLIGLLVTAATGNSDPVAVFSTTMNSKLLTILTLAFIAFAQVTTNVLNNIVPPAYVLVETFNIKWSWATIIVGYYILRKKQVDVNTLYDRDGSPYKGVNWAAVIAIIVGSAVSCLVMDLSWYISLIPTGVVYYLLMRYANFGGIGKFRAGTIYDTEKEAA